MQKIKLNDILKLENLKEVKIRFVLMVDQNWDPINVFKNGDMETLLKGQYWNYKKQKSFKNGQISIGFIPIDKKRNKWLLFHVGKIIKDLGKFNDVGYKYVTLNDYDKYIGRLVINFNNKSQNLIRNATSIINNCEVEQILPDIIDDIFPGYDKVNISWMDLSRVVKKQNWKTALENQKGVYLITDTKNGKMYVGSAYGEEMILGRWQKYIDTGHGRNVELKKHSFNYIKKYFKYSILDVFKSTTDEKIIRDKENIWKEILLTREFGYNKN